MKICRVFSILAMGLVFPSQLLSQETWTKGYGIDNFFVHFSSIVKTADGGYMAFGGKLTQEGADIRVLKLDVVGEIEWEKFFKNYGDLKDAQPSIDGGYVLVSLINSTVEEQGADVSLLKISSTGEEEWRSILGGSDDTPTINEDVPQAVIEHSDGSIFVTGYGNNKMMLLKASPTGEEMWQKWYPGEGKAYGRDLVELPSGEIVVVGSTLDNTSPSQRIHWILDSLGEVVFKSASGGFSDATGSGY